MVLLTVFWSTSSCFIVMRGVCLGEGESIELSFSYCTFGIDLNKMQESILVNCFDGFVSLGKMVEYSTKCLRI